MREHFLLPPQHFSRCLLCSAGRYVTAARRPDVSSVSFNVCVRAAVWNLVHQPLVFLNIICTSPCSLLPFSFMILAFQCHLPHLQLMAFIHFPRVLKPFTHHFTQQG